MVSYCLKLTNHTGSFKTKMFMGVLYALQLCKTTAFDILTVLTSFVLIQCISNLISFTAELPVSFHIINFTINLLFCNQVRGEKRFSHIFQTTYRASTMD